MGDREQEHPSGARRGSEPGIPEDPTTVVRKMFDAFRQADVTGILETVHPESRWTYIGANPQPRRASMNGHDEVRRFFQRIVERLDMRSFEPSEFVVQGAVVVVFGSESGLIRETGKPFHNDWVQKYVIRDGKITEMEEFNIATSEAGRPGGGGSREVSGPEERIDDALKMTFPASDPPSWPSDPQAESRRASSVDGGGE